MVKTHRWKRNAVRNHLLVWPIVSFNIISDLISRIWANVGGVNLMVLDGEGADGENRRPRAILEQIFGCDMACKARGA